MRVLKYCYNSLKYALNGIQLLVSTQINARIHLVITALVLIIGLFLKLNVREWVDLTLVTGLVWTAEAFNTAIEYHVDDTSPETRRSAGNIKDIAAGAVVLAALTALITGILILGPPILQKIS